MRRLRDYFVPPCPAFAIGDAVELKDGRAGVVIGRDFDMRPAVTAYRVWVRGAVVIARPEALAAYVPLSRRCAA